jgi:competence protein ComEC
LASVLTGSCGLVLAIGLVALILLFARWQSALPSEMKMGRRLFFTAVFVFALAAGYRSIPGGLTVTMLDVGQGDAFVIQNRGKTFLIDGGGLPNRPLGQNTGATVLLPYLDYLGVNRLDGVFVTHPDRDHIFGILETAQVKPIRKIYVSATIDTENPYYQDLRQLSSTRDTPLAWLYAGDSIQADDMSFFVLYPMANDKPAEKTANETSLVIRLQCRDSSVLFTGDIDIAVEEELLAAKEHALNSTILKLAHHGSKNGNTQKFLESARPRLALVSAGRNNAYGLPAEETIDRLRALGIPCYNTARYGAIVLRFDGQKVNVFKTVGES